MLAIGLSPIAYRRYAVFSPLPWAESLAPPHPAVPLGQLQNPQSLGALKEWAWPRGQAGSGSWRTWLPGFQLRTLPLVLAGLRV